MLLSLPSDKFNGSCLSHRMVGITKDDTQEGAIVRWWGQSKGLDVELVTHMLIAY